MANHLDLDEQEQLDHFKHLWSEYGRTVLGSIAAVVLCYACWHGYQFWQHQQATQAAVLFDEVESSLTTKDPAKIKQAWTQLQTQFPKHIYAPQAGLLVAKYWVEAKKPQDAIDILKQITTTSKDANYQAIARLRWAGLLMEKQQNEAALKLLDANVVKDIPPSFQPLLEDRRADLMVVLKQLDAAKVAYKKSYQLFDAQNPYRRVVEIKLNALGVNVSTSAEATP